MGAAAAVAAIALGVLTPIAAASEAPATNGQCAEPECFPPALQVTKHLQLADGTTVVADGSSPWEFTLDVSPTPIDFVTPAGPGPSAVDTTDASGQASFEWEQDGIDSVVDLVETPQDGWVYNGAVCSEDGQTIFDTVGDNVPGASGDPDDLLGIDVSVESVVECDVYNREETATITIRKLTDSGDGTFTFTTDLPGHESVEITTTGGEGSAGPFTVPTGTYSITEDDPTPWIPDGSFCNNEDPAGDLTLRDGGRVTCTFFNSPPPPTMSVTKTPSPSSVAEPGGSVTYTVEVTNTSLGTIYPYAGEDSVEGGTPYDITTVAAPVTATTCAAALDESALAPSASRSCTFTVPVAGEPGDTVDDEVTIYAYAWDESEFDASAEASVSITDVPSSIEVTKTAGVSSVPEPGADVTYTVGIENTSATDTVTIDEIADSIDGGTEFAVGGTCAALLTTTLAPGDDTSCTFDAPVSGNGGDVVSDVVTVRGTDDDDQGVSGDDTASVSITDVAPGIDVTKTPSVDSVPEPGADVVFTLVITNTSEFDPVTLTGITDSVEGGDPFAVAGTCDDLIGTTLAADGGSATCEFTQAVEGDAGDVVEDEVTVTGRDDDEADPPGAEASGIVVASAQAAVAVTDVEPAITVTKDNGGASVVAPGGPVDFDVTVTNDSVEPVELTSLTDAIDGATPIDVTAVADPITATDCAVGGTIAPGATYACTFTATVTGEGPGSVTDVVAAVAVDDEENEATDDDDAVTDITPVESTEVTSTTTPTTEPIVPTEPSPVIGSGTLARTGGDPSPLVNLAVAAIGVGAVLLIVRRGRLRTTT